MFLVKLFKRIPCSLRKPKPNKSIRSKLYRWFDYRNDLLLPLTGVDSPSRIKYLLYWVTNRYFKFNTVYRIIVAGVLTIIALDCTPDISNRWDSL
jgi:hypothetical protein